MKKILSNYIEHSIIDEYADKNHFDGYSLHINDLPKNEIENFLSMLFDHDEVTKDLILDRMHELIDSQLPIKECKDKYEQGYVPVQDRNNGEIFWRFTA